MFFLSHQFQTGEILNIDDADDLSVRVRHNDVIDLAGLDEPEHFHRQSILTDGSGIVRHHFSDVAGEDIGNPGAPAEIRIPCTGSIEAIYAAQGVKAEISGGELVITGMGEFDGAALRIED